MRAARCRGLIEADDFGTYVCNALAAGADGFLLKDTDPAEILRAVHLVAAGSAMLHPTAARRLIDRYHAALEDCLLPVGLNCLFP